MTARKELEPLFAARSKAIDSLYQNFQHTISCYVFDTDAPKFAPTRRQRLRGQWYRFKSWLATPFVWVVKLLDPAKLDNGDW